MTPTDFSKRYEALSKVRKLRVRYELRKWCGWSSTSVYRKLSGTNLTLIEQTMIERLIGWLETDPNDQLQIDFEWDEKNGPILKLD